MTHCSMSRSEVSIFSWLRSKSFHPVDTLIDGIFPYSREKSDRSRRNDICSLHYIPSELAYSRHSIGRTTRDIYEGISDSMSIRMIEPSDCTSSYSIIHCIESMCYDSCSWFSYIFEKSMFPIFRWTHEWASILDTSPERIEYICYVSCSIFNYTIHDIVLYSICSAEGVEMGYRVF